MPVEQPFTPPPRKPVSEFPTPSPAVAFYTELVNRDDPAYKANAPVKRGTRYSTIIGGRQDVTDQYPDLFFLRERKFQLNDQLVLWDWATDENAPDSYNAAASYVSNAVAYPAFTRVYTIRRELYESEPTLAIGSSLTALVAVTITNPGEGYTTATGTIDGTDCTVDFVVSGHGELLVGVITNEGADVTSGATVTIMGDGIGGSAVAVIQPADCVLTAQKKEELAQDDPLRNEFVRVTRVYETLPGPFILATKIDKDGVIVYTQTRRNIAANITESDVVANGVWTQTTRKPVDNFIAEEIVEARNIPGNEVTSTKVDQDGKILTTVRTLVSSDAAESSEFITGTIWTRSYVEEVAATSFVKDSTASNLISWQIVETRELPGNPIPSSELDKDGLAIDVVKTMKQAISIVTQEEIDAGIWIRTTEEPITDLVSWEVVKAREVPGLPVPSANIGVDHETATIASTLKEATTIAPDATEDSGIITTTEQKEVSEQVSEEIVTTKPFLDEAFYSIAIPDVIPEIFRAFIPTDVESHIVAGIAAPPVLGFSEFERSEKQLTKLLKEVRFTVLATVVLPFTIAGLKETNDKKQVVTVSMTLELDSTTPTTPDELTDVDFRKLGNGMAVEIIRTIPNVFVAQTYEARKPDVTPEVFKATIPLKTDSEIVVGSPSPPTLGSGEYEKSEREVTEFTKETSETVRDLSGLPSTVTDFETSNVKQVVTVAKTLEIDSSTPTAPDATTDITFTVLGDGTAVEEVRSVPDVFNRAEYAKEIPDVVPLRFRVAVPTSTTALDSSGSATPPTLGTGDLSKTEEQVNEFVKRETIKNRSAISYPVTLVDEKLTPQGQVETVTETLDNSIQSVTGTALIVEADVQNLGDGTSLKTVGTVPDVFKEGRYETKIPDLVPEEFRPFIPTTTTSETSAGTASTNPPLGTGDLTKIEEQVTEFKKRVTTESRGSIVLPITHSNKKLVEEYGGGIATDTLTLANTGSSIIDQGFTVVDSKITDLGNGTEIKETTKLFDPTIWPIITSRLWDENMRLEYDETQQIVTAGTPEDPIPGGVFAWTSEIKAIDQWRSRKINISKSTPLYTDSVSALVSYEFKPFKFPGRVQQGVSGLAAFVNYQAASARLIQHTIRTWWLSSSTTPTIAVDEIITDTVLITGVSQALTDTLHDVVFDAITGAIYGPTTPSYSEYTGFQGYYILTGTITLTNGSAAVLGSGTSFLTEVNVGDQIGVNTSAYSVQSVADNTHLTLDNPWIAPDGDIVGPVMSKYGSGWIGTERVIAASVTPEREKDIWKVQTQSVIMR